MWYPSWIYWQNDTPTGNTDMTSQSEILTIWHPSWKYWHDTPIGNTDMTSQSEILTIWHAYWKYWQHDIAVGKRRVATWLLEIETSFQHPCWKYWQHPNISVGNTNKSQHHCWKYWHDICIGNIDIIPTSLLEILTTSQHPCWKYRQHDICTGNRDLIPVSLFEILATSVLEILTTLHQLFAVAIIVNILINRHAKKKKKLTNLVVVLL